MRLLRSIVLANVLAAVLLAGVVIALRPRDVQGGVVISRGDAVGIGHSWGAAPPTSKALHGQCMVRRAHDPNEIDVQVGPINHETDARFHSSHLLSRMRPEEI